MYVHIVFLTFHIFVAPKVRETLGVQLNKCKTDIFFKISDSQQCLFLSFVRYLNWTWNCFLFWFSKWYNAGVISGSQMSLQLLQNTEIIKQTEILLWKIWRKYGSVLYLFSCKESQMWLQKWLWPDCDSFALSVWHFPAALYFIHRLL